MADAKYGEWTISSSFTRLHGGTVRFDYHVTKPDHFGIGGAHIQSLAGRSDEALEQEAQSIGQHIADLMHRDDVQRGQIPRDVQAAYDKALDDRGLPRAEFELEYRCDDVPLGDGGYIPRRWFLVKHPATHSMRAYMSPGIPDWVDEFAEDLDAGKFN